MNLRLALLLLALPACAGAATPDMAENASAASEARRAARFQPFRNESDTIVLGDLTIENRRDRIELYGALAITRDQAGLELARSLKRLIDATVDRLQASALPERIQLRSTDTVDSPFAAD